MNVCRPALRNAEAHKRNFSALWCLVLAMSFREMMVDAAIINLTSSIALPITITDAFALAPAARKGRLARQNVATTVLVKC
jgi:hypothetical protein